MLSERHPVSPDQTHQAVEQLHSFREGHFTVQGDSSALVAPNLDPQPGEEILDLCSAPGGKTTHLAELMADRGRVNAVDLHPQRLQLVERAARRLGLTSIRLIPGDGRAISHMQLPLQQRILVDAPCSGLGAIRRLPEIKWRCCEADLPHCSDSSRSCWRPPHRFWRRRLSQRCATSRRNGCGGGEIFAGSPSFIREEHVSPFRNNCGVFAGAALELLPHRHGMTASIWPCGAVRLQ